MHRSATSLTAKALNNEIYMGDNLMGSARSNPKGHFEEMSFVKLNDWILKQAGGSWDNPPSEKAIMEVECDDKIKMLISLHEKELWGWKDPRTSLTIRKYLPFLENPHFICNFRNPKDVAISLKMRDGMELSKGIALAKEYNSRVIKFLEEYHVSN